MVNKMKKIAGWVGENIHLGGFDVPKDPHGGSIVDKAPPGVFLDEKFKPRDDYKSMWPR